MNDIEIWHRLFSSRLPGDAQDVSILVGDLRALAALEGARRCAFFGLVQPFGGHADADVREAAVAFLSGVQGQLGLGCLVGALDDDDARVREAAARSLHASSGAHPYRWAHAIFHARAEVRRLALEHGAPRGAEPLGSYLRADPENADRARESPWPRRALPLVVDLYQRGAVSAPELCSVVVATVPADLAAFLSNPPARSHAEIEAVLAGASRAPPDGGEGAPAADIFDVFLRAADAHPAEARAVCEGLAQAALRRRQTDLRRRLAAALLCAPAPGHDAVALACVLDTRILLHPAVTAGALPALERWLWRLREQAPKLVDEQQLRELLDLPLFRDAGGAPRLAPAAALCGLFPGRPLHALVRHLGEGTVVDTLCAHPGAWDALCRLPAETPSTALHLLAVVAARDRPIARRLAAMALVRWSSGQKDSCAPVLDAFGDDELGDVVEEVTRQVDDRIDQGDTRVAEHAVANVATLLRARLRPGNQDAVLDRLLMRARPDAGAASQLLHAALKSMDGADLAGLARRLAPAMQLHLTRLLESVCPLPLTQELAVAGVLADAEDAQVRRWAARVVRGAAAGPSARPTLKAVHTITDDEARRIATCPESELEKALARALEQPSRGLCDALRARPEPNAPIVSACAALLACGDPLPEIHDALERFGGSDGAFYSDLDAAAVTLWHGNDGLPPLGHAWLHRWEQHAFALAGWLEAENVAERFIELGALPPGLVREQLWEAFGHIALIFRYRSPARLNAWAAAPVLDVLLAGLAEPGGAGVAKVIVGLVEAGLLAEHAARIRQRILEVASDLDGDTRSRLGALARFDGIPEAARRAGDDKPPPATVAEIRRSDDLEALLRVCRQHNRTLVSEALLRLLELGPAAGPVFRILAREWPALPCPVPFAESIALWTDEEAIAIVRALVSDPAFSAEARFRAARGLVERGEEAFVEDALVAAIVDRDDTTAWFRPADWSTLIRHADATRCALALAQSPHPHAYQNAALHLLGQPPSSPILCALRDFLAMGSRRPLHLRRTVARRLLEQGDTFGLPVIADLLLDNREKVEVELYHLLPPETRAPLAAALTASTLAAGDRWISERRILVLAASGALAEDAAETIFMQILEHGTDAHARAEAAQRAQPGPGRGAKLDTLARTFAWGVRRGRDITGRLFRVHMTPKRQDLGYTFLTESRVFVSPLPILRGDRHGQAIVEGLILHELGHHAYHTGEEAAALWTRAHKEGIGPLLNLVADEHLERNLRALDAEHGDRLKQLCGHAFLHARRDVKVETLLDVLLGGACEALTSVRLGVSHDPASVEIESGPLLRALSNRQGSFARFVRALRLGQGNRWNDPLVAEALSRFGGGFRRLDMKGLYDVAAQVAQLFGGRQAVAALFGGHESIPWSEREGQRHGDDISDEEVQREVDRILDPRQGHGPPGRGKPDRFALNVNPSEAFDRIEQVQRLPYDAARHRPVAISVRRHAMRLRDFLHRLGRALVPRRARLRGRAFDRTRVRAVVTRRDPRMLVAREIEVANDIFVGTIIDCSSSMQAYDNIEKAKRFGVLVAEAVRDLPGVEARFFGFTERVIFDAGDGGRCAVTSLESQGGNNDAAALYHAARVASGSARRTRVLVMISDGLPTECSVSALRALVGSLGRRGFICAQVAVHPLEEVCFPNYVVLDEKEMDLSVARFGELIMKLVARG